MQTLPTITPTDPIEQDIYEDFLEIKGSEYTPKDLAEDIGDDDNAGGYIYTPDQLYAFCTKYNINPTLPFK